MHITRPILTVNDRYNAFVVTDHNDEGLERAFATQKLAREKYNDQVKVLIGEVSYCAHGFPAHSCQEWSNCRMHMGLIGLKEYIPTTKYPTDEDIQQIINATHAQVPLN